MTKTCTRCETPKPLDDFYTNKKAKDGHQAWCKVCARAWKYVPKQGTIRTLHSGKAEVARAVEANANSVRHLPLTRGDCEGTPRPCPYISCRQNLSADVSESTGTIKLASGSEEIEDWERGNCALDWAGRGSGMQHDEISQVMKLTRQRVQQIEERAVRKLARDARARKWLKDFFGGDS